MRSFFEREFEKAQKENNIKYQQQLLTIENNKLKQRQRYLDQVVKKQIAKGVNSSIVQSAFAQEREQLRQDINTINELKYNIKEGVKNTKTQNFKIQDIAKRQTYKEQHKPTPLTTQITETFDNAQKQLIERMIYKGQFMKSEWDKIQGLQKLYPNIFNKLGFTLDSKLKQTINDNYSSLGSGQVFDTFVDFVQEAINKLETLSLTDEEREQVQIIIDELNKLF